MTALMDSVIPPSSLDSHLHSRGAQVTLLILHIRTSAGCGQKIPVPPSYQPKPDFLHAGHQGWIQIYRMSGSLGLYQLNANSSHRFPHPPRRDNQIKRIKVPKGNHPTQKHPGSIFKPQMSQGFPKAFQ